MSAEPQMSREQLEQLVKLFPQLRTMLQAGATEPTADDLVTVADIVDRYWQHCVTENVHTPHTRPARLKDLEDFKRMHGHLLPANLKPFHLTDWIASHAGWKSTATRRARAAAVKAVFEWARRHGRIASNPFTLISYEAGEPRSCIDEAALNAIIGIASPALAAVLKFLRLTGARVGETCQLSWPGVDLEKGLATFAKHKTRRKTRKPKVIPLTHECVELLRTIGPRQPGDYVFVNLRGKPWTPATLYINFRHCRIKLGLPLSIGNLHGIRHLWATEAIKNHVPLKYVSQMLGHSSQKITEQCYVSIADDFDGLRRAAELAIGNKAGADSVPVDLNASDATKKLASASSADAAAGASKIDATQPLHAVREHFANDGKPVGSFADLPPSYALTYRAMQWAIEQRPELAQQSAKLVHEWLIQQPKWSEQLPASWPVFRNYLRCAREYLGQTRPRSEQTKERRQGIPADWESGKFKSIRELAEHHHISEPYARRIISEHATKKGK